MRDIKPAAYEPTEYEYVQQLADDFGLTVNDTIGTLLEALETEENESDDEGDDGNA